MRCMLTGRAFKIALAAAAIIAVVIGVVASRITQSVSHTPSSAVHAPTHGAPATTNPSVTQGSSRTPLPTSNAGSSFGTWVNITPAGVSTDFNNPPNNFGMQVIQADPQHSGTIYVGTCYQGIWKTTDGGKSWKRANTGQNGNQLDGRIWGLALDRINPQLMWAANGAGGMQGIWKSTDGGIDWTDTNVGTVNGQTVSNDIYAYATDPYRAGHVLVTFHTGWNTGASAAGFLESFDAGATWIVHQPPPGSDAAGSYIFFLDNSKTWLLTESQGYYRTSNGGTAWAKVSDAVLEHGGNEVYRAHNGALYAGAVGALIRSTDDGLTWAAVAQTNYDGYNAVIGDGAYIYAQEANTGGNTAGSPQPYIYTREDDGTHWQPYNSQRFGDGPMSMTIDLATATVYSSNWDAGVWKLVKGT
jgi:photosystem II stability/assembly factor-like uncharacterized protein